MKNNPFENSDVLAILAEILSYSGECFGDNNCNDYNLKNTPENKKFVHDMQKWSSPDDPDEWKVHISKKSNEICTSDVEILEYFAHLAKKAAGLPEDDEEDDEETSA